MAAEVSDLLWVGFRGGIPVVIRTGDVELSIEQLPAFLRLHLRKQTDKVKTETEKRKGGRQCTTRLEDFQKVQALFDKGQTYAEISKEMGISRQQAWNLVNKPPKALKEAAKEGRQVGGGREAPENAGKASRSSTARPSSSQAEPQRPPRKIVLEPEQLETRDPELLELERRVKEDARVLKNSKVKICPRLNGKVLCPRYGGWVTYEDKCKDVDGKRICVFKTHETDKELYCDVKDPVEGPKGWPKREGDQGQVGKAWN